MTEIGPMLIPMLIAMLIVMSMELVIGAVLLKLTVRLVSKFKVPFGRACWIVFVVIISILPVGYFIDLSGVPPALAVLIFLAICFFVGSGIFGAMIEQPNSGQSIGFQKGMLVFLVVQLLEVATYLVMTFVFDFLFPFVC